MPVNKYALIKHDHATYQIQDEDDAYYPKSSFKVGVNIIGVRFSGVATVRLPGDLESRKVIVIKDEAGSGDITITVE